MVLTLTKATTAKTTETKSLQAGENVLDQHIGYIQVCSLEQNETLA